MQEEIYRNLVENLPVMLAVYQDGFKYVNKAMCEKLGWTFKEITSPSFNPIERLIPQEFRRQIKENIRRVLREEHVPPFLTNLKRKDGSEISVLAVVRPFIYQGKPAVEGTLFDLSSMEQIKQKLLETEKRTQKILDIAEVAILMLDLQGRVKLANRKTCKILGYESDEVIGKDWVETFIPKRFRRKVREVILSLGSGDEKRFRRFENPVLTKGGNERIIEWHNAVLRDEKGRIVGILSSGLDVTERKSIEERLRELAYRLNGLRPGGCFVSESADRCFKAYADLTLHGVPGLCIAREDPERLINRYGPAFKNLILLSSKPMKGFKAVSTLQDVSLEISEFLKMNHMAVILLDGSDYLIAKNGFEPFYRFIQEKRFDFIEKRSLLLLHLDLNTLTERERALLLSEVEKLR